MAKALILLLATLVWACKPSDPKPATVCTIPAVVSIDSGAFAYFKPFAVGNYWVLQNSQEQSDSLWVESSRLDTTTWAGLPLMPNPTQSFEACKTTQFYFFDLRSLTESYLGTLHAHLPEYEPPYVAGFSDYFVMNAGATQMQWGNYENHTDYGVIGSLRIKSKTYRNVIYFDWYDGFYSGEGSGPASSILFFAPNEGLVRKVTIQRDTFDIVRSWVK